MKRFFRNVLCLIGLAILFPAAAQGASKAAYVVLPFTVQGPQGFSYLERSIPQMLTSRLYWKDRVEPAVNETPAAQKPAATESEAAAAAGRYKADYVVWGSVTVAGDDCSLDVLVRDRSGKVTPYSRSAKTTQLIAVIKGVSDNINRDLFGRNPEATTATARPAEPERVNRMNPDLVVNEDRPKDVYLNPQFRYSGSAAGDGSRLRSQTLKFTAIGMEVVDADGDGKNEVILLSDTNLYAYRMEEGAKLAPLGEFKLPATDKPLCLRALPHAGGRAKLVVSMVDRTGIPASAIFTFDGRNFKQEAKNVKYFLNVVKLPPDYRPTLIGQAAQPPKLFRPGVSEMVNSGGGLSTGRRLDLPEGANVFNFAYLPGGKGEDNAEKLVMLNSNERLVTYTAKGARLAQSEEQYSGAAVGVEVDPRMPGLGNDTETQRDVFYIPMRMPAVDLDGDGNWELIVNRPISTASQLFERYRFFPQSEIHSVQWDGTGLNLVWKTRRIKGSVVDYAITDVDNDGTRDLVVCINTHPGALGVDARKTVVLVYPLDVTKTDAPVDQGDIYD